MLQLRFYDRLVVEERPADFATVRTRRLGLMLAPGIPEVQRQADDNEQFSALAFKMMDDKYVGNLTFVRVYSGVLSKGDTVYNSVKGKKERIGRIVQMSANDREEIEEIRAGDIAACIGLADVATGETLCDPAKPIVLERMVFPDPVIHVAVEPNTKADQRRWVSRWAVLPAKILRSACVPTKNPVRPSSPAWASCTSKSSSTA